MGGCSLFDIYIATSAEHQPISRMGEPQRSLRPVRLDIKTSPRRAWSRGRTPAGPRLGITALAPELYEVRCSRALPAADAPKSSTVLLEQSGVSSRWAALQCSALRPHRCLIAVHHLCRNTPDDLRVVMRDATMHDHGVAGTGLSVVLAFTAG